MLPSNLVCTHTVPLKDGRYNKQLRSTTAAEPIWSMDGSRVPARNHPANVQDLLPTMYTLLFQLTETDCTITEGGTAIQLPSEDFSQRWMAY